MPEDGGYRSRLRRWMEEDRERRARQRKTSEVSYRRLKVRMSLGCWIWIGGLVLAACLLAKWIFNVL